MSSRNMCLLPRATLHSDSEQGQPMHSRTISFQTYAAQEQSEEKKNNKLISAGDSNCLIMDWYAVAVRYVKNKKQNNRGNLSETCSSDGARFTADGYRQSESFLP
jgi:hypothetical protein